MQNITRIRYHLLLILSILILVPGLKAQQANTMYFMQLVPQRYQINPAFQGECNAFFGLPGLSPLQVQANNSSFGIQDVLEYNEELDSLITFLHPLAIKNSPEKFLSLLQDVNYLESEVSVSLASFGFRSVEYGTYFTFDIRQRVDFRASYPDDIPSLPIFGPDSAMTYNFSGLGIDVKSFSEFSMGISQRFGDRLTIGWRGKLLFGQAALQTQKFDMEFTSNEDLWPVYSQLEMNASLPFMVYAYDENGQVDLEDSDIMSDEELQNDIFHLLLNPKNFGLAMDLGVEYKATDWLNVSASLVDFGAIRWKDGTVKLKNEADYEFRGIKVDPDDDDFLETFLDSIDQTFNNFDVTEETFRTWLTPKAYVGAEFYLHPRISVGILSKTSFYPGNIREQVSLSANFRPLRMMSANFSYSVINGSYKNLGFGLGLRVRPFNMYIITDTGPSIALWPYEARNFNMRLGFNLVFGCPKKQKVFDKPLVD